MYSPEKSSWLNPNIDYVLNSKIVEYDIESAGINLIIKHSLLPIDLIRKLKDLPKIEQNIAIGKLQRDIDGFSKNLLDAFTSARSDFITANKLNDSNIIAVKKDAIFTIGDCQVQRFKGFNFRPKNEYSSFIKLKNIELYYSDTLIDTKGIGDLALSKHRLYLLDWIREIISKLEIKDPSVRRDIRKFIDKYKAMELDDGYYLEFTNRSASINELYNLQNVIVPLVQITIREIRT
jgi:hypothetical protein